MAGRPFEPTWSTVLPNVAAYAGLGEAVEATYYLKRIAQRQDLFPDIDQRLGRLGH